MASNFYIVHHEFRAGTSSKWWKTAYAAMAPGGGWDEAVAAIKEKGFITIQLMLLLKMILSTAFGKQKKGFLLKNSRNSLMVLQGLVLD